jgi:hypothetical protein
MQQHRFESPDRGCRHQFRVPLCWSPRSRSSEPGRMPPPRFEVPPHLPSCARETWTPPIVVVRFQALRPSCGYRKISGASPPDVAVKQQSLHFEASQRSRDGHPSGYPMPAPVDPISASSPRSVPPPNKAGANPRRSTSRTTFMVQLESSRLGNTIAATRRITQALTM